MREAALLLLALLAGCGGYVGPDTLDGGPRWHLDRPFYIDVSSTMPKPQLVLQGMRRAVSRAGGTTTLDEGAGQVLTLLDTDGSYCQRKGVEAWAALPATGKIYFCHSALVLSSYTLDQLDDLASHELGHVLANRGDHLGGEPAPGDCPSRDIMASNRACRSSADYTAADRAYICNGNVVGGMCRPRQLP